MLNLKLSQHTLDALEAKAKAENVTIFQLARRLLKEGAAK